LLVVGAVGCGGAKKALPGSGCVLNSDCNDGLSCTDMRCHVMCREAIDCGAGQLCAGPPGAGICLLPDEETCGLNSDCKLGLFCAIDLTCRTQCVNERDCPTATQKCVPSEVDVMTNVCAEPADLDDDDTLKPAADGGATPDDDAGVDASGSDAGADGVVGPVADAGQSGDAGEVVGESEPNEDREHATPYTPGTTVLGATGSAEDVDFYETVVPAGDLAGGYYQASITDVGEGRVKAIVYTASDDRIIHQASSPTNRGSLFFYWAAAREQKYRIEVNRAGSFAAPYKYALEIRYTRVNDAFEPNDNSDGSSPKQITLGMPITAYFFTGFKQMVIDADDYQDWFVVDLPAGMTTVRIDNVTGWRPQFDMIDAMGNPFSAARKVASAAGASIEHAFMVTTPGMYRAVIQGYASQPIDEADSEMTVPDNFTKPYTLTISQ
jgi:hypothetical protein